MPAPGPVELAPGPRTVVVAGDDGGPPARVLAERAGWPLLAEPTSGARTGSHALRCYRLLLDGDLGQQVERGLVLGPDEARPDLTVVVVNDDGGSIFAMLEQGAPEYADRYDRLFGTPHGV